MKIKLPFGLKNSELIHISDALRGIECDCRCPHCNSKLIAKKGKIKVPHFAHYDGEECQYGLQTAVHLAAKSILEQNKKIKTPGKIVEFKDLRKPIFSRYLDFDTIKLEKKIDGIIPDIITVASCCLQI